MQTMQCTQCRFYCSSRQTKVSVSYIISYYIISYHISYREFSDKIYANMTYDQLPQFKQHQRHR